MSSEAVQRYLEARQEHGRRREAVDRMVGTVEHGAKMLQHWQTVEVINCGLGFPKSVSVLARKINALAWPTALALAETLVAWHEANQALLEAWDRVPPGERQGLPAPGS